jgi:sugar phosphate isomerase/epimerase
MEKNSQVARRDWITGAGLGALAVVAGATPSLAGEPAKVAAANPPTPFGYCLNTSTVRGNAGTFVEKLQAIARAGFRAIEPWMDEIVGHVQAGGSVKDLHHRCQDLGLSIINVIAFHDWIVDDATRRKAALEQARRDFDTLAQLEVRRVAAPPAGAVNVTMTNYAEMASRYREFLQVGEKYEIAPQLELWGFSKTLSRVGEVAHVAIEADHPSAGILLDVYHLHKGGNAPQCLDFIAGDRMHLMHLNDYPGDPPRETIKDSHRVFPGDGVAPLTEIFQRLAKNGFRGYVSLELFNGELYTQDPLLVCRVGLEKMQAAMRAAFSS